MNKPDTTLIERQLAQKIVAWTEEKDPQRKAELRAEIITEKRRLGL